MIVILNTRGMKRIENRGYDIESVFAPENKNKNNYDGRGIALLATGSRKAPSWAIGSRENEKEKRKNMKRQQTTICNLRLELYGLLFMHFSASLAFFARLLRGARRVIT